MHGLGHCVVGLSGGAGLHLGHTELRLQEQVQAAVGQQQGVLNNPAAERNPSVSVRGRRSRGGRRSDGCCGGVQARKELMIHQFRVECLGNFTCSGLVRVVFLLLQKRLEALHALADLLSVV